MIKHEKYKPPFKYVIDLDGMPAHLADEIYEASLENEYRQFDYSDGCYHFVVEMNDTEMWKKELSRILDEKLKGKIIGIWCARQ